MQSPDYENESTESFTSLVADGTTYMPIMGDLVLGRLVHQRQSVQSILSHSIFTVRQGGGHLI